MERKHSNLNSPKNFVGLQIYLKVLHVLYIHKRNGEEKKKLSRRSISDNYQQTFALQLNNEQSPEELLDTLN